MLQYDLKVNKATQGFFIVLSIISIVKCMPRDTSAVKPGRYIPELFGGHLGKYTPDDSGKYYHIPRPYDGGYGDRGVGYINDASGKVIRVASDVQTNGSDFFLGPKDHLRFMIDFNYDKNGWQIIKFDWLRDGDENYKYKYVNENQLWYNNDNNGNEAEAATTTENYNSEQNKDETEVQIDGEYDEEMGYDYSYPDENTSKNSKQLQQAIKEVLDYIEINILPTL